MHDYRTILVLVLIPLTGVLGEPTVECVLHTPPAGRLHMTDLWWLDLNNPTRETLNVWLEGHVEEARRGEVYHGETWPFELPPGWKRIRLPDIRIRSQRHARGYEVFVLRTGSLPEGEYSYWVIVRGEATGGDTATVRVGSSSPPRLVSPRDGSSVAALPTFQWTAPAPPVSGVTYELKIVEVLPGQSKEEAIQTIRPWFLQTGIRTNSFTYPGSARSLIPRKRYAWQIKAVAGSTTIGVSAVWEFYVPLPHPAFSRSADLYFCDANEVNGSVYHRSTTGMETRVYTRPVGRIYSFLFAPWDADKLYFVDANQFHIYLKKLGPGAPPESVIYTHTTYVRDIEVDPNGRLYFSEATGAGGDGKVWRLNSDGSTTLYYRVALAQVDGFWSGDFCFDRDGVLYLSTGNRVGSSVYRVLIASNTVQKLYTDPGGCIEGITFGQDGLLYYADWHQSIYALDLETGTRVQVYNNSARQWLSDVRFKPFEPGVTVPGGVANWVMPWGVGGTMLPRIDSQTGLTSYDAEIHVDSAPFGGQLGFRSGFSSAIPTPDLYYYRWEYRPVGGTWQDFDEEVSVYYVKERAGFLPVFETFRLGPNDVGGKKLYRFKPHNPPSIPGTITYWPTTGFLGDIYSGYLNTVAKHLAPGKYEIRLSVFDSLGNKKSHGSGFRFVVPVSEGAGGTISTRLPNPNEIDAGEFRFFLYIDNRPCSAYVDAPTVAGAVANDTCGFLRYDPSDTSPVHIAFQASQPGGFAFFSFRIYRGTMTCDSSYVLHPYVFASSAGVYSGNGAGNYKHDFLRSTLLGPCHEAAFSENLYVYAKATTGWGHRISSYDASYVRAFALSEKE